VIVTSVRGFRANRKGSDVTAAPGFMVACGSPPNLNVWSVFGSIALPPAETAICTAASVTGLVLNSLENRIRKLSSAEGNANYLPECVVAQPWFRRHIARFDELWCCAPGSDPLFGGAAKREGSKGEEQPGQSR